MKGHGSPQQQQGRRRGYFGGRGGRGSPATPNHYRGNIPTIGAFLDLPPGKDIAPGSVTKWMAKLKEYAMTTFKSRVSMTFGPDGMGSHENLSMYLTNTKSALTAIQQAYAIAGREGLDDIYPEG